MQPFANGTNGGADADVEFASDTVSCFSISMAKNPDQCGQRLVD